ncbi:MAG: cobalamin biosynthesis protein CbiA [Pseudomonadota bacterium]
MKPKEKLQIPDGSIIFVGNYGSGKTEVAVNFALYLKRHGEARVHLVDLDIVNPYFRSREAIHELTADGIDVVAPTGENFYSESPIILPRIGTLLRQPAERVILDVGGDDAGATVLASLKDAIRPGSHHLWMVLNARRPFTDTVEGSVEMIRKIEAASKLKMDGIVSNTHLLHETTIAIVTEGFRMAQEVARSFSVPVPFVAMEDRLVEEWENAGAGVAVLPLHLTMRRPWEKEAQGGTNRA